jgi:hypothetical protein
MYENRLCHYVRRDVSRLVALQTSHHRCGRNAEGTEGGLLSSSLYFPVDATIDYTGLAAIVNVAGAMQLQVRVSDRVDPWPASELPGWPAKMCYRLNQFNAAPPCLVRTTLVLTAS